MKPGKIFVIAYANSRNLGDNAIFDSLCAERRSKGFVKISFVSFLRERRIQDSQSKPVMYYNIIGILWEIITCKEIVWGGGGLIQKESSSLNLLYYLSILTVCTLSKKCVNVRGMGVSPISGRLWKLWLTYVLDRCKSIKVRDQNSLHQVRTLTKTPVTVEVDLAFNLKLKRTTNYNYTDYILLMLRPPLRNGSNWLPASLKSNTKEIQNDLASIKSISDAMRHAAKQHPSSHFLFCACHYDRDLIFSKRVAEVFDPEGNKCDFVENEISFQDAYTLAENANLCIAMRYHGCIAAIRANTPLLALSYSDKVAELRNITCKSDISYWPLKQ